MGFYSNSDLYLPHGLWEWPREHRSEGYPESKRPRAWENEPVQRGDCTDSLSSWGPTPEGSLQLTIYGTCQPLSSNWLSWLSQPRAGSFGSGSARLIPFWWSQALLSQAKPSQAVATLGPTTIPKRKASQLQPQPKKEGKPASATPVPKGRLSHSSLSLGTNTGTHTHQPPLH